MISNYYYKERNKQGFTLVELLVVIAILGILATIGLEAFTSSQMRGRDTQRKSDLKQIASALELYYSDYGSYPPGSSSGSSDGEILRCKPTYTSACAWGSGVFTDAKTVYFKALPKDPSSSFSYYYRSVSVNGTANQGFQLFAHLENTQDINCLPDSQGNSSCSSPYNIPNDVSCGANSTNVVCNFAVTSSNTTPSQE